MALPTPAEQEIIDFFKSIEEGTQCTVTLKTIFGQEVKQKMTYGGKIEQWGFLMPGGSWGLYDLEGDRPCYKVLLRRYRRKAYTWIRVGFTIRGVSLGWETVANG